MNKLKVVKFSFFDKTYWSGFIKSYENNINPDDADPIDIYIKAIEIGESELYLLIKDDEVIGFYLIDVHEDFNMLNHIAINRKHRKNRYAIDLISHLKGISLCESKFIVVEVMDFYKKLYTKIGFRELKIDFYVPHFGRETIGRYNLMLWNSHNSDFDNNYKIVKKAIEKIYEISYYIDKNDPIVLKTLATLNNPPIFLKS